MTKNELIAKYSKKCDEARSKYDKARRNKFMNIKQGNEKEAHWDELEQESYAKEFHLTEKFLTDLKQMQ